MIYRRATHEDLSFLSDLEKELEKGKPDLPYWEDMSVITHPMLPVERVTVADNGLGIVVGMVGSIPMNEDSWYLVNLYVDPEYRGHGVAKGLIDKASELQAKEGRRFVMAIVADKAGEVYERMGFNQVGRAMSLQVALTPEEAH